MSFFHRIALIFTLLGLLIAPARGQVWHWAAGVTSTASVTGADIRTSGIVLTAAGETYAAYQYSGSITLGGQTYTTPGTSQGLVVARHDRAGNVLGIMLTGTDADVYELRRGAAAGHIYIVGKFGSASGQLTINGQQINAASASALFVAQLDEPGILDWIRQAAVSSVSADGVHLTDDNRNKLTVSCLFTGTATFGTRTVRSATRSLLLVQYNSSGQVQWLRSINGQASPVEAAGVAAAADGTLYVVGSCAQSGFTWSTGTGTGTVPDGGPRAGFWLKLTVGGDLLASQRFGSSRNPNPLPLVATDAAGACYVAARNDTSVFDWGTATVRMPAGRAAGVVVARLGTTGRPEWVQTATVPDMSTLYANDLRIVTDLTDEGTPRLYVTGAFSILAAGAATDSTLQCGPFALPPQYVGASHTEGFLLALDGFSGAPAWLRPVGSSDGVNVPGPLDANAAGEVSVGGHFAGDTAVFDGTALPNPTVLPLTRAPQQAFTAKLRQRYNLMQGTVFTDTNANSIRNTGEPGSSGVVVAIQPGGAFFSTEPDGQYSALADLGTWTVSIPNPPRYYTAVPVRPASATFGEYGNVSGQHSFALQPAANQRDVAVSLTPVSRARPGFAVSYRLTARNVGTVAVPLTALTLLFDSRLTFVSSSVTATLTGRSLAVPLGTLTPGQTRQVDVLFQLAITTPLGYSLAATATLGPLSGDLTPADNVETSTLTVGGAYDPNDISVNYATLTLTDVQNATRSLDYTVRFQNIGTDTAFLVVLRDTLPTALLNLGTVQVLAASHTCLWRLVAGGILMVSFPNVQLPPRSSNTLRSTGFVRFRVVPYTTLAAGALIPNAAQIHFDYNAPLVTNTALTTVLHPAGVASAASALAGGAWPNPATAALQVAVEQPAGQALYLTLRDALGRVVRTARVPAGTGGPAEHTFGLAGLAPGLYVVRAEASPRVWSQRVVVR